MVKIEDIANRMGRLENLIVSKYVTPELTTLESDVIAIKAALNDGAVKVVIDSSPSAIWLTSDGAVHEQDLQPVIGTLANAVFINLRLNPNAVGDCAWVKKKSGAGTDLQIEAEVSGQISWISGLVAVDASQVIEYYSDGADGKIEIIGWLIPITV